nr:MAG TPA: hypothetical protein [Caudoviricetes sp.]
MYQKKHFSHYIIIMNITVIHVDMNGKKNICNRE